MSTNDGTPPRPDNAPPPSPFERDGGGERASDASDNGGLVSIRELANPGSEGSVADRMASLRSQKRDRSGGTPEASEAAGLISLQELANRGSEGSATEQRAPLRSPSPGSEGSPQSHYPPPNPPATHADSSALDHHSEGSNIFKIAFVLFGLSVVVSIGMGIAVVLLMGGAEGPEVPPYEGPYPDLLQQQQEAERARYLAAFPDSMAGSSAKKEIPVPNIANLVDWDPDDLPESMINTSAKKQLPVPLAEP